MAVPNSMQDLATLASSNSPAGSEAIGNSLDNYLRAHAAIIRSTNALASASVAAASTTDIGSADGERVTVTGAATITSLGTGFAGCRREVLFTGAPTLVHSANIALPGAVNLTVAANDIAIFRCTAAGQWSLVAKNRTTSISGVTPSAFILTLLDDADAVTARATLGTVAKAGDTFTGGMVFGSSATFQAASVFQTAPAHTIGTVGSQQPLQSFGWNNAINRWRKFLETDASLTFYSYDAAGGLLAQALNLTQAGTLTVPNVSTPGAVTATGAVTAGSAVLGGGKRLTKITVSSSAPGALVDGELYLRY